MRNGFGVVVLVASSISIGMVMAPAAAADSCDPAVAVCDGGGAPDPEGSSPDYSPPVATGDDQYPFDGDWYFNPAGGGTALQPNHPSGGGGGGGHH